jgi:sulfur-carrier protein adenylyltransferase/sulfurtransferase
MVEMQLSPEEKIRYQRHLNIPEIGENGQLTLKMASVLVVGAGGLGSASACYLAAAGVGTIGIVDSDKVELSNLQRQILHDSRSIGRFKVESAKQRLNDLNPNVRINTYNLRLLKGMDLSIFEEYPIIVDATDNFETRYFLNEICVQQRKIFIYGSIFQFFGQMSVFDASKGPCFRCVFRNEPSNEYAQANQGLGVVGALPGTIGTLQAIEVIKLILTIGNPAIGRLLLFDGLEMSIQEIITKKDPLCPVCGGSKE